MINKVENYEVELIPEKDFFEETNFPDWYGYMRID